jgi:carotenoid cleavage dioxygenase
MSIVETNRYLLDNYAPVLDEITATDLPVEGTLPPELNGRYLRNGPNPAIEPDPQTHHWFAGDGMVHGIRLNQGRAEWYRNRFVGSRNLSRLREQEDIPGPNWSGGGVGPNTNVGGFAGRTWAMVEAGGCPVELDYELETVARNDFFGTLPGSFTAHPKVDPQTGEMHAMVQAWSRWRDRIQYVVVGPDGRVDRAAFIPLPGMTMLHDMSLTDRYAVVYDQPCTVNIDAAMEGLFPFRWNPDHGNRVGLVPRRGSFEGLAEEIVWIDVPNGYSFHPLNAYDTEDGKVVIDLCNYERMFEQDTHGPFETLARLERWELDPQRSTSSITVVDERSNEFPRHRGSLSGKPYRYGYCAVISHDQVEGWKTVKHDLETGDRHIFDHGPGRCAGEAVFVARENSTSEDDGWLLCFVHDLNQGTAEFVVMDALDLNGSQYVARVQLPQRVPFGFHGNWVSDHSVPPPAPPADEPAAETESEPVSGASANGQSANGAEA